MRLYLIYVDSRKAIKMKKHKDYIVRVQKENPIDFTESTITIATYDNEHDWYELIINMLQAGYKFSYRMTDENYNVYVVY